VWPGLAYLAGTQWLRDALVAPHQGDSDLPSRNASPFSATFAWLRQVPVYDEALGIDVDDARDIAEHLGI